MIKYPTGVAPNKDKLRVWFMYQGSRRWETLGVPDTPKNRKMAGELRASIVYQIKTGTFDYRSQFPDSPQFKSDEINQGDRLTMEQLAAKWLKLKKPEVALSSYHSYERRIRVTLEILGEDVSVKSIRQEDMLNLRHELLTGVHQRSDRYRVKKSGRSATTVNGCMRDLLALFTFAHANGYIAANPMANMRPLKKSIKKPDPITREEFPRLLAACTSRQTSNFWALAILTGLRHGELCALAWEDIDLVAGTITVSRNLTNDDLFTPPKTTASHNRVVCLIDAALQVLRDQMELTRLQPSVSFTYHTREYQETFEDQKTFVFNPSIQRSNESYGQYYSVKSIGQTWTSSMKRAGLRHRKAYQSRHTFACWSLSAGANPNYVAAQMGHANSQMVYQVYGSWMEENNLDQVAMLNQKLNEFVLPTCYRKESA